MKMTKLKHDKMLDTRKSAWLSQTLAVLTLLFGIPALVQAQSEQRVFPRSSPLIVESSPTQIAATQLEVATSNLQGTLLPQGTRPQLNSSGNRFVPAEPQAEPSGRVVPPYPGVLT